MMKELSQRNAHPRTLRRRQEQGFTIVQMVVTVAVATVLLTFGFMGIARARASMQLTNASEQLSQHLERARQDSMRRHATTAPTVPPTGDQVAVITFVSADTYIVAMDFDGDGTVEANERRTYTLPEGVTLPDSLTDPDTTLTFDWRGRPSAELTASLTSDYGGEKTISITESGGVTVDGSHTLTGFDMAAVPAPNAVPKSEFDESTSGGGTTTGGGTGNGKKDDGGTTTDGGGTTTGDGGTTTGGGGTTTGGGGTTTDGGGGTTTDGGGTTTDGGGGTTTDGGGGTTTDGGGGTTTDGGGGTTTDGGGGTGGESTPKNCSLNEKPSQTGCICQPPMRVRTNGKCQ